MQFFDMIKLEPKLCIEEILTLIETVIMQSMLILMDLFLPDLNTCCLGVACQLRKVRTRAVIFVEENDCIKLMLPPPRLSRQNTVPSSPP